MLTGFNHNIKHKGQTYHIQTEDSGVKAPHIITHLFIGGNIIATKKTSYADVLGTADLEGVVRKMMEEQHKNMLRKLIHGNFDKAIELQSSGQSPASEPEQAASQAATQPDMPAYHEPAAPSPSVAANSVKSVPAAAQQISTIIPPAQDRPQRSDSGSTLLMTPVPPMPGAGDQAALAAPPQSSGVTPAPIDIPEIPVIPPPPMSPDMSIWEATGIPKLEDKTVTYSQPTTSAPSTLTDMPLPPSASTQPLDVVQGQLEDPGETRLDAEKSTLPPEVIAAQQLAKKPKEQPAADTIFGEDLMSEKSLDEVILSYLSGEPNDL